jgi:hypothetical protein
VRQLERGEDGPAPFGSEVWRRGLGAVAGVGAGEAGRHGRGPAWAAAAPPVLTPWPHERGGVRARRRG